MKKSIFIFSLFLISFVAMSQKVNIQIIKTDNSALSQWQILDQNFNIVFSGNEYFRDDSVFFSLDANKRYYLQISIIELYNHASDLYTLKINGEPVILIKSDIEPGDHFYPFFTGIRDVVAKITGGTTALIADFPWQVYFISGNFRCGGSIIAPDWILTAAHCTKDDAGNAIPTTSMSVKVGANNPNNPLEGQTYSVSSVIVNEGYNDQTLLNDIALLKLATPINTVNAKPIKLITSNDVAVGAMDPGVMVTVTGWGLIHVNPDTLPRNLQKVQLPVITNAQASTVWVSIPSSDVMAGFLNGNKDACNGDSGGPLAVSVVDGYKIAGIVSWGSANCNTYGAYTRVSLFEDWIRTNTGIVKEYFPPAPTGDSIICKGVVSSQYSVTTQTGATAYEWKINPANAGVVSGNTSNAAVIWNTGFTGSATLLLRVTINTVVSEWSRLNLKVVLNTRLLNKSGDTIICANQPIILKIGAEGNNLTYKWFKNGTLVQSGPSSQLSFSSATIDNSGAYTCQVIGSCGTVFSTAINLTVYPLTKVISVSPDTEVPFGGDITLKVNAQGHDLIYEWKKDSVAIDNSNTSGLFLQNMNASGIGLYKVTITGTCGTDISRNIYVYVKKENFSGNPEVFLWPSVTISEFNVALSNDALYNVNIYNSRGQLIKELSNCRYQISINVSTTARGTYIVEVFNSSFRKSLKFVKQ